MQTTRPTPAFGTFCLFRHFPFISSFPAILKHSFMNIFTHLPFIFFLSINGIVPTLQFFSFHLFLSFYIGLKSKFSTICKLPERDGFLRRIRPRYVLLDQTQFYFTPHQTLYLFLAAPSSKIPKFVSQCNYCNIPRGVKQKHTTFMHPKLMNQLPRDGSIQSSHRLSYLYFLFLVVPIIWLAIYFISKFFM